MRRQGWRTETEIATQGTSGREKKCSLSRGSTVHTHTQKRQHSTNKSQHSWHKSVQVSIREWKKAGASVCVCPWEIPVRCMCEHSKEALGWKKPCTIWHHRQVDGLSTESIKHKGGAGGQDCSPEDFMIYVDSQAINGTHLSELWNGQNHTHTAPANFSSSHFCVDDWTSAEGAITIRSN